MMADFIYLGLGLVFGALIMLNHKSFKERKTYEQVDEHVRSELSTYRNLCDSLKEDVAYLKQQLANERAKNVDSRRS